MVAVNDRPAAPTATTAQPTPRIWLIIGSLMLTMLMSSLGQMIFATALPTIVGELGGVDLMMWVITAFLLGQTIMMPIAGKLGDQIGRKPLYLTAISIFVLGSLIGGFADSMTLLIVARTIQGMAAGALMITSQAILADIVPPRQRGKYMGAMGAVFGVSSVLGPVLGGWFTDGPGWRWGLWFNIPLGLIAIAAAAILLTLPKRGSGFKLDAPGIALMATATTAVILLATWGGNQYAWGSWQILGLAAVAILAGLLFVLVERTAADPLIPLWLFANRNFVLTTLSGLILGVAMLGTMGYLPTYLQMVHMMSPTDAGLMLIPLMVGMIITSTIIGQVVTRTGRYKVYPIIGFAVMAVSFWLLGHLHADTSLPVVGGALAILGIGLGLNMQLLVLIVQNSFPIAAVGTATASNNFFRQIGGALGSAMIGGIFVSNLTTHLAASIPPAVSSLDAAGQATAASALGAGVDNLTPHQLATMPAALQQAITSSYNDALTPVFIALIPLTLIAGVLLFFLRNQELRTTVE